MSGLEVAGVALAIPALMSQANNIKGYLDDVKGFSAERSRCLDDTENLLRLLRLLQERSNHAKSSSDELFKGTKQFGPLLNKLQTQGDQLQKMLEPPKSARSRVWGSITWPAGRKRIKQIFAQIQRSESLIIIALNEDHIQLTLSMRQDDERRDIIARLCTSGASDKQADALKKRQKGTLEGLFQNDTFKAWEKGQKGVLLFSGRPGAGKTIAASAVVNHLQERHESANAAVIYLYLDYRERIFQTPTNLLADLLGQLVRRSPTLSREVHDFYMENRDREIRHFDKISRLLQSETKRFSTTFVIIDALDECQGTENQDALVSRILSMPHDTRHLFTSRSFAELKGTIDAVQGSEEIKIKATPNDIRKYVKERLKARRLQVYIREDPSLEETIGKTIVKKADGMFLIARLQMNFLAAKLTIRDLRSALFDLPTKLDDLYANTMQRIADQDKEKSSLAYRVLSWVLYASGSLSVAALQHALTVRPGDAEIDVGGLYDEDTILSVCAGLVELFSKYHDPTVKLVHHTALEYLERAHSALFHNAGLMIATTSLAYLMLEQFGKTIYFTNQDKSSRDAEYPFYSYASENYRWHARGTIDPTLSKATMIFMAHGINFINWLNEHYRHPDFQSSRLHVAAKLALNDVVRHLLDEGVNINASDHHGQTPLHVAAMEGHSATVSLLLERGADKNSCDKDRHTPLHTALSHERESTAQVLMDAAVDSHAITKAGKSALDIAAQAGNLRLVQRLIDAGLPVNLTDATGDGGDDEEKKSVEIITGRKYPRRANALYYAVEFWNLDAVNLLLQHGGDVQATHLRKGNTALHAAMRSTFSSNRDNSVAIAKALLKKGADVSAKNSTGKTALHLAASGEIKAMVQLLLRYNPELCEDEDGETAIYIAAKKSPDVLPLLLNHFGQHAASTKRSLSTARLFHAVLGGDEHLCGELLRDGADIDCLLRDSDFVELIFSNRDPTNFVMALLQKGFGPDSLMVTLFDKVTQFGHFHVGYPEHPDLEKVTMLLDHGANTEALNHKGITPLQTAVKRGQSFCPLIKLLVDKGAHLDAQDIQGRTALYYLFEGGPFQYTEVCRIDILEFFIQHGADVKAPQPYGQTPLHLAAVWGTPRVLERLIDAGVNPLDKDNRGLTALDKAVQCRNSEAVRFFLSRKADRNPGQDPSMLLVKAIEKKGWVDPDEQTEVMDVIDVLLNHGASLNASYAPKGETLAHRVAYSGWVLVLQHLLKKGADPKARDNEGLTVMDWANLGGHDFMIIYLRHVQKQGLFGGF